MKPLKLLILIYLLPSIVFGQTIPESPNSNNETVKLMLDKRLPSFSAEGIKGEKYSLENLKGKVVFINFWFLGCPPCLQELDQLYKVYDSVKENPDVAFLSITFDDKEEIQSFMSTTDTSNVGGKIRNHFKKQFKFDSAIPYPIISMPSKKITEIFKIRPYPTSFIIDKKGIIRLVYIGLKLDEPEDYLIKKYTTKINELLVAKD